MTTLNPVYDVGYKVNPLDNPVYFGPATDIVSTAPPSANFGIYCGEGVYWQVTNAGTIGATTGPNAVAVALNGGGSLTNGGSIYADGSGGAGVWASGGSVTNAGSIVGAAYGVVETMTASTVVNSGAIAGGSNAGVQLMAGGTVSNSGTVSSSTGVGVTINGPPGVAQAVANSGTISSGTISSQGSWAVELGGGSVTNAYGGTLTSGVGLGVCLLGAGSVTNAGTIDGEVYNASGGGGAVVTNESGGVIKGLANGDSTVLLAGPGSAVYNAGAIYGAMIGVTLEDGWNVTNEKGGTISGDTGVYNVGNSLTNGGSIVGTGGATTTVGGVTVTLGDGVDLTGASAIAYNQYGGSISGARYGMRLAGASAMMTNAGAISGGTDSIVFDGSGDNTLFLETGSTLTGDVVGSTAAGATNTLILQGTGTADNSFDNFAALDVWKGADWTLGGASTIGATTVMGKLTVGGALATPFTISNGGALTFTVASDDPVAFDGAGTLVLEQAFAGAISGYSNDDTIDLPNLQYDASSSGYTVAPAGNGEYDVTVTDGAASATLVLASATSPQGDLTLAADPSGGTLIEFVSSPSAPNTFDWNVAANVEGQFGSASSWTDETSSAAGPPTANDDVEINQAAEITGTGVAKELDFNAPTTVDQGLTTTVASAAVVNALVTVSSGWTNVGDLQIGGSSGGTLIVTGSGDDVLETSGANLVVGENSGATGTLDVENGALFWTNASSVALGATPGADGVINVSGAESTVATVVGVDVGAAGVGSITVANGANLRTALAGTNYQDFIGCNPGTTGSVTVTGAGSTWMSDTYQISIGGPDGVGALNVTDGGYVQSAEGVWLGSGSNATLSVDSDSTLEVGTLGGAALGYITVDPNAWLGGFGTINGAVIDNGWIGATPGNGASGVWPAGAEVLTINGNVAGTGMFSIGEDATLALLNGSVASPLSVIFNGWYGTLAIGEAANFQAGISSFDPGDTIDLSNVKYAADWSYTYSNGDLAVTIGGATYNLNVSSDVDLQGPGVLTLSPDASGNGADITFTNAPTTPFQLWSTLPSFFFTASGPVDGEDWARGNVTDGGYPIWVQTETAATSSPGQPATYNVVLTSQDWLGTEQPMTTVATIANIVNPFSTGNLAAATVYSSDSSGGQGDVIYWGNSPTTPGDYAVFYQPFTTTYPTTPDPTGQNTALDGSAETLIDDIPGDAPGDAAPAPLSWNFATNATATSPATELVFEYATQSSPGNTSTQNIYMQGFSIDASTGALTPLTAPVEVAAAIPDSEYVNDSFLPLTSTFYFNYTLNGSAAGQYSRAFDPSTGALGGVNTSLALPNYTSVGSATQRYELSDGALLRFAEGTLSDGQQVIQDFFGNGSSGAITTFDLSSSTPDHWQIAGGLYDPNDGQPDYTALIYSDNGAVHLELINEDGQQVGQDFIVPGLTSFDQIQVLSNPDGQPSTRVEIDYTAPDPNGGQQIEGAIYDMAAVGSANVNIFDWNVAANVEGQFGSASSWTDETSSVVGPPTASDCAEIDQNATITGGGLAYELDFNAPTTVDQGLTTTVASAAVVNALVTVSSGWTNVGDLQIGGSSGGTLIVTGSGNDVLETSGANLTVGENSGATGTLDVENGALFWTNASSVALGATPGADGVINVSGAESTVATVVGVDVGAAGSGSITVRDGGGLDTAIAGNNNYQDVIGCNPGTTGSVTVTGAGSTWTSDTYQISIGGPDGVGALNVTDGGYVQSAEGVWLGSGSNAKLNVDSDSTLEVGTLGGAALGYITVDPNAWLGGFGTINGAVIDNGGIGATPGNGASGVWPAGAEVLTINGNVAGTGMFSIGEDATLALNGSVAPTLTVMFQGWDGALTIGDAPEFSSSASIWCFNPGDTIDLTDVPYVSGASYTFTQGTNGAPNDLAVTIGGATYNFNVGSDFGPNVDSNGDVNLTGALTLSPDASGSGTDITFANAQTPPPFQLWATLPSFFFTSSGPVTGEDWARGNVADGGYPIWVQTETTPGQPGTYNVVLTSQDWLGTEQPMTTVATIANIVHPSSIGTLAAATVYSSDSSGGQGDVIYWGNSPTTPGDYAIFYQPFATTYPTTPDPTGQNTALDGSQETLIDDIPGDAPGDAAPAPLSWNFATNATATSPATELVFEYATQSSPGNTSTQNIYMQGFSIDDSNGAMTALTAPVEVAAAIPDSEFATVGYEDSTFYFSHTLVDGTLTGAYSQTFDPTTGALGTASEYLDLPSYTSFGSMTNHNELSYGANLRFAEGTLANGQAVIQDFLNNGSSGAITTFKLSSASDHWQVTPVFDPNSGALDDTALVYSDSGQVYLDLLNEEGQLIGGSVIPGLTSFDQIQTLTSPDDPWASTRVEIDYTVGNPSVGEQVEGVIYDTAAAVCWTPSLGQYGDGEYAGTPYDDRYFWAPGVYTIAGGGGVDTFTDFGFTASQVSVYWDSQGDVVVNDGQGDIDTLQRFSTIELADATITINGYTFTETQNNGGVTVSSWSGAGAVSPGPVIEGTVDLSNADQTLTIIGGGTMAGAGDVGPGTINVSGASAEVNFQATQTVDNATINLENSPSGTVSLVSSDPNDVGGQVLTLGADVTVNVTNSDGAEIASGWAAGDGIVNEGTINVESGQSLEISGANFDNQGSLTIDSGGQLTIDSGTTFVNTGVVDVEGVPTFLAGQSALDRIVGGFTISDTAVAIEGALAALAADADVASITSTAGTVTVSVATFLADQPTLAKVGGGFDVSDTAANVSAALDQLSDANLDAITVSDRGAITASAAQLTSDATTLAKLQNSDGSPYQLAIVDTAANVSANLDALNADSHITSISLTNGGTPTLTLSIEQALNDRTALSKIVGAYTAAPADTAANIESITPTQALALEQYGYNSIASTTGPVTLTTAEALMLIGDGISITNGALTAAGSVAAIRALTSAQDSSLVNAGYALEVVDTAANIQALKAETIVGLAALHVGEIEASDASLAVTAAQALACESANIRLAAPSGDCVIVSDTAGRLEGLTAAQFAGLPAIGVSELASTNATVKFTVTQTEAILGGDLAVTSPSGTKATVSDTGADIETLTAGQLGSLAAAGFSGLTSTSGGVALSGAQAVGLESSGLKITVPSGQEVTLSDVAANIEALSAAQLAALSATGASAIAATDAGVTLSLAQAIALESPAIKVSAPSGSIVAVDDTAADIVALTTTRIAGLKAVGVTSLESADGSVTLTIAQATALETAGVSLSVPTGGMVSISDTAANIQTLTAAQIAGLSALDVTQIVSTNAATNVDLTAAQATAFEGLSPLAVVSAASGSQVVVSDTAGRLEGLTAAQFAGLPAIGVSELASTNATVKFTVTQTEAILGGDLAVTSPSGTKATVSDTGADIETLTAGELGSLAAAGFSGLTSTSGGVALSGAQAVGLESSGLKITVPSGQEVTLSDVAANIEALSAAQLAALSATGASAIAATDAGVTLSLAQAIALESPAIKVSAPSGSIVAVDDTAADIVALTTTRIAGLKAVGVTSLESADGSVTLTIAQATALETAGVSLSVPTGGMVSISDTAANIQTLTAAQIAGLSALDVTQIVSTNAATNVDLTAAQATAFEGLSPLAVVSAASGSQVVVSDTAGRLEGLTAAQIAGLSAIGITALNATGDATFSAAQTSAIASADLTVSAAVGHTVTETFSSGAVVTSGEPSVGSGTLKLATDANGLTVDVGASALNVTSGSESLNLADYLSETITATGFTNETFEFSRYAIESNWSDTLTGFVAGAGSGHDYIELAMAAFGATNPTQAYANMLADTSAGSTAVITDIYGDKLTLTGVTKASLNSADFKFV